jgi:hypothetical protein
MSSIFVRLSGILFPLALWAGPVRAEEPPVSAAADPKARIAELNDRTLGLAKRMDDLSAEAQDLAWNHTNPKLAEFLKEIDNAMLDARDLLEAQKTGGETVAAQQDVLEKIYEAAKKAAQNSAQQQQQQQQEQQPGEGQPGQGQPGQGQPGQGQPGQGQPGQGQPGQGQPGQGQPGEGQPGEPSESESMNAMLKMMEQMLGITPTEQPGQPGSQPGDQPGDGLRNGPGTGDDDPLRGRADNRMAEERTVPRAAGNPSGLVPSEYRGPMESFRKALDELEMEEARANR